MEYQQVAMEQAKNAGSIFLCKKGEHNDSDGDWCDAAV